MKASKSSVLFLTMALTGISSAQLQVNGTETGSLNTPIRSAGRTYLAAYENETLTGVTGVAQIIGVRFRGTANATSLTQALTDATINFSDFNIVLGLPSNALISAGEFSTTLNTFDSWSTSLTTVRSGALTMGRNFWQTGQWTPTVLFDTPFTYNTSTAAGLLFGFTHPGGDSTLDSSNFPAATRAYTNWTSGQGADAIFATNGGGFAATPSGFVDPLIVEFVVVPEPATVLALGMGALAVLRRRQKS